jgi:hypothetical protein
VLLAIAGVTMLSLLLGVAFLNNKSVVYRSRAGENPTVALKFDPTAVSPKKDDSFTVVVKAKPSADMNVQGYTFKLAFDTTKVQVTDIAYQLGVVSAGLGDTASKLADVNAKGIIKIQGEVQNATGSPLATAADTDVVKLTFKQVVDGGSRVILTDTARAQFYSISSTGILKPAAATLSDLVVNEAPTATPAPSSSPSGAPNPSVTGVQNATLTLNLKLKFQGILSKPADAYNKMTVKVTVVDSSGTKYPGSGDFVADANGIWSGTVKYAGPKAGDGYQVFVKGPKHIQKKICEATPAEQYPGSYHCVQGKTFAVTDNMNLDFSGIYLLAGDLPPQDGLVDSYDMALVRNCIVQPTEENCVKNADINLDGRISAQDYSLMIAARRKLC